MATESLSYATAAKFMGKDEVSSSLPPDKERGMTMETEHDKARRLLVSLAVDTQAKRKHATQEQIDSANLGEHAFAILGEALGAEMFDSVDSIDVAEPAVHFHSDESRLSKLSANEPKPRFKVQTDGSVKPIYDLRAGAVGTSLTPTPLTQGEYEIHAVHARTKSPDGTTMYCCVALTENNARQLIQVDEKTFVDSFILAQHTQIQSSIDQPATVNPRLAEVGVKDVLRPITVSYAEHATATDPKHKLEPAKIVDHIALEAEAGDKLRPSRVQIKSLAERMKVFVDQDTSRTGDSAAIQKYIDAMEAGQDPSADAVLEIIKVAGRPKLNERVTKINEEIDKVNNSLRTTGLTPTRKEELEADKDQLLKERTLVQNILAGAREGNTVYDLLHDIESGRGSPELASLLKDKFGSIVDPTSFFEMGNDDLANPNSLASIILKHFGESRGLTDEQMQEKVAWLSKFLSEHGSDIAMMGIFALFQMMTGIVSDAVKHQ